MSVEQFSSQVTRFATAWQRAATRGPQAAHTYLDRLLARGITDHAAVALPAQTLDQGADLRLRFERALIRRSGLLDIDAYLAMEPGIAPTPAAAVRHFCSKGWRQLLNPSTTFDLWWYTTEHLDPRWHHINPVTYHVLLGAFEGLATLPDFTVQAASAPLPDNPRRICLFAGFDRDGRVDDYVVDYVRELSRHAEVYYLADCELQPGELDKLTSLTHGAWAARHGGYDFGSYSRLANELVGWERLSDYDEVLFVNDASYLLRPLDEVFATMSAKACDAWGLQVTVNQYDGDGDPDARISLDEAWQRYLAPGVHDYREFPHIGSYFFALRSRAVADPRVRKHLDEVVPQPDKRSVILKYETGTTYRLAASGLHLAAYVEELLPFHPIYRDTAFALAAEGFPVLKRALLTDNPFGTSGLQQWKQRVIDAVPEANVDVFERNLHRITSPEQLRRSFEAAEPALAPGPAQDSNDLFHDRWIRFVAEWQQLRSSTQAQADQLIDGALTQGLAQLQLPATAATPDAQARRACEIAVIRRSGLVDVAGYRTEHAEFAGAQRAVRHFCISGWRTLWNPSTGFDVWWYWFTHLGLDEQRINPLLHFALAGRRAGLSVLPPTPEPSHSARVETEAPVRRAVLFAGFDIDGLVDDYVIDYVRELSRFADVFYLADCDISAAELAKLDDITVQAWAWRHGRYDFGSWALLANELVGWGRLEQYDEVLLVNDSAYLLGPLDEVFDSMSARSADWWGLQATKRGLDPAAGFTDRLPLTMVKAQERTESLWTQLEYLHVSSYFLAMRRAAFTDPAVRRLFDQVGEEESKSRLILKYELGLSRALRLSGHEFETFIPEVYPYHPLYTADFTRLIGQGFPLLKRNLLSENPRNAPDLVDWKPRVAAVAPAADLEMFERNLLRVADDAKLQRSFSVITGSDGVVDIPVPLTSEEMAQADVSTTVHDDWWAFPVCAYDHTLSGNERAVFEVVKDDPSIKKIILTRSRRVELSGANVEILPISSPAGQQAVLRAGTIFVKHAPRINVPYPLDPDKHRFINLWHGIPLKRFGWPVFADDPATQHKLAETHMQSTAVITSSKIDSLAMVAAFHPLKPANFWPTGLPRNDFVVRPRELLPADLRDQVERLQEEVGERRLVMFLPTFKDGQADAYYTFTDDQVDWLRDWGTRHNAVLGVREHMADKAHTYSRMLAPTDPIDLSSRRFPDLEAIYRVGSALISDYSSCLVDFQLTGNPVISFAYDYEHYANVERGLFYQLNEVLPGPVCHDFDSLAIALERVFDERSDEERAHYARRRSMFFDHLDDRNAERVVDRTKLQYTWD